MRINADLMRRRRRELGISERDLAAAAGVSKMFIRHLESGGGDDQVTMEVLRRIGRALATSVTALILEPNAACSGSDVAVVGAMLTELDEPTTPSVLASALDWELARTGGALAGLAAAAPSVGLALQRLHGLVSLRRSTGLDPDQLRRGHATSMARRGLDVNAARMLYLAFSDQLGDKRRLNVRDRQALAQLRNAGLVIESAPKSHLARQRIDVSPDALWSLRPGLVW